MAYLNTINQPGKLLLALSKEIQKEKYSVLGLGRQFYSCNNSIYDAIDFYESKGLIEVRKLKRDLKIRFTDKGAYLVKALWMLEGL